MAFYPHINVILGHWQLTFSKSTSTMKSFRSTVSGFSCRQEENKVLERSFFFRPCIELSFESFKLANISVELCLYHHLLLQHTLDVSFHNVMLRHMFFKIKFALIVDDCTEDRDMNLYKEIYGRISKGQRCWPPSKCPPNSERKRKNKEKAKSWLRMKINCQIKQKEMYFYSCLCRTYVG